MKNVTFKILVLILMLIVIAFFGVFNISTAKDSMIGYVKAINEYKSINSRMETIVDDVSKSRKELQDLRGPSAVDLEDADAIYKAVTSINGVSSHSAILLRIRDGNISKLEDYSPSKTDITQRADGIQITVKVKDVSAFLKELDKLQLPRLGLNVVHPDNVIITFNTKGGQV